MLNINSLPVDYKPARRKVNGRNKSITWSYLNHFAGYGGIKK